MLTIERTAHLLETRRALQAERARLERQLLVLLTYEAIIARELGSSKEPKPNEQDLGQRRERD